MLPLFSLASIWLMPPPLHPRFPHSAVRYVSQLSACSVGTSKLIGQLAATKRRSSTCTNPPAPSATIITAFGFAFAMRHLRFFKGGGRGPPVRQQPIPAGSGKRKRKGGKEREKKGDAS